MRRTVGLGFKNLLRLLGAPFFLALFLTLVSCFNKPATSTYTPVFAKTGGEERRIIEVATRAELDSKIKTLNKGKLLVMLTLYTCPYCRALKASLEEFLASSNEIQVVNLDISAIPQSSYADKGLRHVPFLEFYFNGRWFKTHEGSLSVEQILGFFEQKAKGR